MALPALPPLRPTVGERVELVVAADGTQLVAVVDDVHPDGALVLRAPVDLAGAEIDALPDGAALTVSWHSARGRHALDVVLGAFSSDCTTLCRASAAAAPRTTQLRRYARASDARVASVVRGDDRWSAVVADISEGGARCVLVDTRAIRAADQVVVHMTVETVDLVLPALVLEVSALPEERSQLRLEFLDIGRDADLVRRHVLDQQRRARTTT